MLGMVAKGGYTSQRVCGKCVLPQAAQACLCRGIIRLALLYEIRLLAGVRTSNIYPSPEMAICWLSKERRVRKVEFRLSVQELRAVLDA